MRQNRLRLSISIVTYAPNLSLLRNTILSLDKAINYARKHDILGQTELFLIDNGPGVILRSSLPALCSGTKKPDRTATYTIIDGHGNIGYGAGHNLAVGRFACDFHLILNPDVLVAEDALFQGLTFLVSYPDIGLLAPRVLDENGNTQYLCKRYPSVLDLLLRGFGSPLICQAFRKRLNRYELRDQLGDAVVRDVPIASGCCMLFRDSVLRRLHGFCPAYFLYFEDFDISLRLAAIARIAYVPSMRITHFGGFAARKGARHIGMFMHSAMKFFNRHGWKWL